MVVDTIIEQEVINIYKDNKLIKVIKRIDNDIAKWVIVINKVKNTATVNVRYNNKRITMKLDDIALCTSVSNDRTIVSRYTYNKSVLFNLNILVLIKLVGEISVNSKKQHIIYNYVNDKCTSTRVM